MIYFEDCSMFKKKRSQLPMMNAGLSDQIT